MPTNQLLAQNVSFPAACELLEAKTRNFFVDLLPGPRDSKGLPEILRFWKTFLEPGHSPSQSPVGLMYGPSGSGKSSLVKAGLLPRLNKLVIPLYVETTSDDTELRVRNCLKNQFPQLPDDASLSELLALVRSGEHVPIGRRLLLVFDQFERWLHAASEYEHTNLLHGLRQCDGKRTQALIIVRDDFWMAVSRFFKALEIRLVDGQNASAVDRFDQEHARKVLESLGRGHEALPDPSRPLEVEQQRFVDQAITSLANEDGTVIGVRLALFAEMVKDLRWYPSTLRFAGGADGIGETYLTSTFGASAKPSCRLHAEAAQSILRALLPDKGVELVGHRKVAV